MVNKCASHPAIATPPITLNNFKTKLLPRCYSQILCYLGRSRCLFPISAFNITNVAHSQRMTNISPPPPKIRKHSCCPGRRAPPPLATPLWYPIIRILIHLYYFFNGLETGNIQKYKTFLLAFLLLWNILKLFIYNNCPLRKRPDCDCRSGVQTMEQVARIGPVGRTDGRTRRRTDPSCS